MGPSYDSLAALYGRSALHDQIHLTERSALTLVDLLTTALQAEKGAPVAPRGARRCGAAAGRFASPPKGCKGIAAWRWRRLRRAPWRCPSWPRSSGRATASCARRWHATARPWAMWTRTSCGTPRHWQRNYKVISVIIRVDVLFLQLSSS